MRNPFGWDLPPGVSPNDPHIVGYDPVPCAECGHTDEDHDEDGRCLVKDCDCQEFVEAEEPEPDWDAIYDLEQERGREIP